MTLSPIKMEFNDGFSGKLITDNGIVTIGMDDIRPYDLLLGALGSCFYATFISIVEKKRQKLFKATLEISGTQRQEVPTTLATVVIKMIVEGASDHEQILCSAELGAKYCSIYETIKKVANIDLKVEFM